MKEQLTLIFAILCISASASNITMSFGYFDSYTGYKVQPTMIIAQIFSATGQVESTTTINPNDKNVSLPTGKYLITVNCMGYKNQVASVPVIEGNATNYEFYLSPVTKDYRLETETVQSKVQNDKMYLNGFVVDENGVPIGNALLSIPGKQQQTTTNSDGYFEILFPLSINEEYISFEISKNGYTKNIYNNVLCWNRGDWSYQVKLRQNGGNPNIIKSTTAIPHIETTYQLINGLPSIGSGSQALLSSSASCVPNSINVAFSSTGTNCCPGGGGGYPSCQTVQNYSVDVYVEHVIPNEWLASWNALPNMIEAFKAGAVAIRSYSINRINHPVYSSWYDICSSPCCQNFGATNSITTAAVSQTTNYVLYYNSDIPLSMYSAENNHLLPQCTGSATPINPNCTDGQFSLNGSCYSDPVSTGKQINGHGEGMSQRGSARWASGYSLGSCSNSTSGLTSTGLATENWTQILTQYYPQYTLNNCGNTCSQPSNDLCGGAISLTPSSACSYINGTTCGASPINPTTGMPTCVLSPGAAPDVWYKFVATNTNATVSVQSAADFDAIVQVLSNVTCASSYTSLQCVNNTGTGGLETVSLTGLTVNNTYWIRIYCNTGSTGTDFQVCVTSTTTANCTDPYEPNDVMASAYNLFPSGLGSSSASMTANAYISTGADQDWYLLNISGYGTLTIDLSNLPADYDLALYTGTSQLLASSTNSGATNENIAYSYTSSSGVTPPFYIKVYPKNSSQYSPCGAYALSVSWTPSATCNSPSAPVPNSGTTSCPGTGFTSSTIYLGYSNSNSNYDIVVEEYPYGSSNIVYTQTCIVGTYPQIASSNIVSGKMYRYYVRATNDCNICNSAYSQPNYFHIVPEIYPNPSVYVCNGTGVTLSTPTITVPSGASVSYQWYYGLNSNSSLISGSTGNTCYVTQSGYYYVKAVFTGSSICGGTSISDQSLYTYVSIGTTPPAPILSSNYPVCEGTTLTLSTPYINGSLYFWTGPNGFTSNNTSISFQTVTVANAGAYACFVTKTGCQSTTSTINVTINPAPAALFTYNTVGNAVTFANTSTNASSYNWTFGDNQTSTQTSPAHTYSGNNNYSVCLTANSSGCNAASDCQLVSLGGMASGSTIPTFAKLFKDTVALHKYWVNYDIIQSKVDSGYIGVGWYQNTNTFNDVIKYYKIDKNGNLVWVRDMPEFTNSTTATKIIRSQNGYLISLNYNGTTVMEIDEQGNKLWAEQISNTTHDTISNTDYAFPVGSFIKAGNSGYAGIGTYTYTHYYDNFGTPTSTVQRSGLSVVKIDNSGNLVWQKQYAYNPYTHTDVELRSIYQDTSGNFYLYGTISDATLPPPNSYDGLIVMLDSNGNHLWSEYYASGANVEDQITSLAVDNTSNIAFSGYSRSNSIMTSFICEANSSGAIIGARQMPNNYSASIFNMNGSNFDCMIYFPSNIIGITTLSSSFSIVNQKQFNFKSVYAAKATLDDKFVICGQYLLSTGDDRYNVFKGSYTESSCLDTTASGFSLSNMSFPMTPLSPTASSLSIVISGFAINPIVSSLSDSSVCFQCNLTASVTPSGATSFCAGDSLMLSANPGMTSYLWSGGQTTASIYVRAAGNYSVGITDNNSCPATSQNIAVSVNPLPYADAGVNQSVCRGSNVLIGTSQIQGNTYNWSPSGSLNNSQIAMPSASPISQTTYTVTVSTSFGCTSTDSTTIAVNPLPIVTANTTTNSVCVGTSVTLTGGGANIYTWTNGVVNGVAFTPNSTATYIVIGTDTNNCQNADSTTIAVNPAPVADFAVSQTSGVCPLTVNFIDLSQNAASATYAWTIYNGLSSPITSTQHSPAGIEYTADGSYTVILEVTNSCDSNTKVESLSITCTNVGIGEIGQNMDIMIYPNPTNDLLNISANGLLNDTYQISMTTVLGQFLSEEDIIVKDSKIEKQMDIKQYASGIYFLTIGSTKTRRVFKINKF